MSCYVRNALCAGLLCAAIAAAAIGPARAAQNSGAIGQIVPRGGVISLSGAPGAIVREVRVQPGDEVEAGDVLMALGGAAIAAERELAVQNAQTADTLAASQVAVQNLSVELARTRHDQAARELTAYRALGPQSTSASELARLESAAAQARVSLQIEQARLEAVKVETAKLATAAAMRLAIANAAAEIRAPSDGTVLRIERRTGQVLAGEPAIQMGDLSVMYVTSQVYEGDLAAIAPGMTATITSASLAQPLTGRVEEVSRLIDTRARLGEVRIRLEDPALAGRLVGMEVEVVIAR